MATENSSMLCGHFQPTAFFQKKTRFSQKGRMLTSRSNNSVNSCKHMRVMHVWLAPMVVNKFIFKNVAHVKSLPHMTEQLISGFYTN